MNASKRKGTRAEHRCIRILEAAGYVCARSGGSLGLFDVIAIGQADVRLIQCKAGTKYLAAVEREQITMLSGAGQCLSRVLALSRSVSGADRRAAVTRVRLDTLSMLL